LPPVPQSLGVLPREIERPAGRPLRCLARCGDRASNRAELVGRSLPDERHRHDDHDGDQGHHEGVLDRGRATFLGSTVLQVIPPGGHTRVETKEHLSPPPSERPGPSSPGGGCYSAAEKSTSNTSRRKSRISLNLAT